MVSRARRGAAITTTATFAGVTLALTAAASAPDDAAAATVATDVTSCPAPAVPDEHAVLLANDGALPLSAHERTVVVVPPAGTEPAPDVDLTGLLDREVETVTARELLGDDGVSPRPSPSPSDDAAAAPVAVVLLESPAPRSEPEADVAGAPEVATALETVTALDAAGWDVVLVGPGPEVVAGVATVVPDTGSPALEHVDAALAVEDVPGPAQEADATPSDDDGSATDAEAARLRAEAEAERLAALLVGERAPVGRLAEEVPAPGALAPADREGRPSRSPSSRPSTG